MNNGVNLFGLGGGERKEGKRGEGWVVVRDVEKKDGGRKGCE